MSFRYTIETENPIVTDGNKMFNCKDGKLRLKIVEANPWHTGTPTEDGDYLVKLYVEYNDPPYYVLKWYKGGWYSAFDMTYQDCPQHSVLKWQKIEED